VTRRERLAWAVATVGGLGERLPAPGTTVGSLAAAALWWAVALALPTHPEWVHVVTAVLAVAAALAGLWSAEIESARTAIPDPGPVVIDEVAGQWVTYLVALPFLDLATPRGTLWACGVGFVIFRLFDVVKPWPVRRLERLPGAVGIMADDLAAGVLSGLTLVAFAFWLG
jgi:phosphatidylglycerophosphatase A